MNDIKFEIMADIERRVPICKRVGNERWIIRCPICGDSQKDLRHAHCYIKCSEDPTEPLQYYCHRCNSNGRVGPTFLEKLNVKPDLISMISKQKYNRIGVLQKCNISLATGTPIIDSPQTNYITSRLGVDFTMEELDRLKVIWNMENIKEHVSQRVAHSLPSNHDSISFLSDDMSMLITRTFTDDEPRWNKQRLTAYRTKSFYTIKSMIDLFSKDPLTVNIAEGVFDVISIFKNFNDGPNNVFIATLGSNYISALDYAITKGFIGSNIIIKIYIDWEVDERSLRYNLKKYKWLFKEIHVYKNILYKDVGVKASQIKLSEVRI